jgi:glycosyltransferase involved in cell wall biosynthesis
VFFSLFPALPVNEYGMHIGLVAPPWLPVPPSGYGGTESVVDALARGLVAAGHEVTLFATGDSTCPVRRAWHHGRAQPDRLGDADVELPHAARAHARLAGVDVIHDHSLVSARLAVRRARPGRRPPLVVTAHNPFNVAERAAWREIARTAAVVAISHDHAGTAPPGVVNAVIHHGIEVDRHPAGSGDGGYALFLGRMAPCKGVDLAVDAARRAGLPLRIAAKMRLPEEIAWFEEVIRPRLGWDVEYLGEVAGTDKAELLRHARVLLNPIRWHEPFGLVMIEALAHGTPVVALAQGSAPEIVDDGVTGFLATDVDGLVAGLAGVAGIDRYACRAAVRTRFSVERMVADHIALYRRLLTGARTHPALPLTGRRPPRPAIGRSAAEPTPA